MSFLLSIHILGFVSHQDIPHTKQCQSCQHKAYPNQEFFWNKCYRIWVLMSCAKMFLLIAANKLKRSLGTTGSYITREKNKNKNNAKWKIQRFVLRHHFLHMHSHFCTPKYSILYSPYLSIKSSHLNVDSLVVPFHMFRFLANVLIAPFNFLSKPYYEGENE